MRYGRRRRRIGGVGRAVTLLVLGYRRDAKSSGEGTADDGHHAGRARCVMAAAAAVTAGGPAVARLV